MTLVTLLAGLPRAVVSAEPVVADIAALDQSD